MAHTLTNYNGVQIVTPEDDLSADRQALNENFEFLADNCVRNPMISNLDAGGFDVTDIGTSDNPALEVNAGAVTSLDGGAIVTTGDGALFVNSAPLAGAYNGIATSTACSAGQVGSSVGGYNGINLAYLDADGHDHTEAVENLVATGGLSIRIYNGSTLVWKGITSGSGLDLGAYAFIACTPIPPDLDGLTLTVIFPAGSNLNVAGPTSLDSAQITTDGTGGLTLNETNASNPALSVTGGTGSKLDGGQITTDGLGTLCLHPQGSPPTPVAGGIYFDGTNFNFCADGSTWVALTL